MSDNEKELHMNPLPSDEPPVDPEEAQDKKANTVGVAIVLGIALGAALGMVVFDNIGIGIAVGVAVSIVFAGASKK